MKKIILFLSLILSGIYLDNFIGAITISKNSGEVLDNSTWINISSLTDKIDVSSSNIKLNGKLYVTGKLCDFSGKCLGEKIGTESYPGLSCNDILTKENSYLNQDGLYWIDPNGGDKTDKFQVYCDMTNYDGGWTLVYKNADDITVKTTLELNSDNLLTNNISLATVGKLSDSVIKQLYTQQFMIVEYGSSLGPNFCKFDNIDDYADDVGNIKYCSQTYSGSANYSGYTSSHLSTRYKGFSSRGITGNIITELNHTDSRKGSHIQYSSTNSIDSLCAAGDGCHTQVWIK